MLGAGEVGLFLSIWNCRGRGFMVSPLLVHDYEKGKVQKARILGGRGQVKHIEGEASPSPHPK